MFLFFFVGEKRAVQEEQGRGRHESAYQLTENIGGDILPGKSAPGGQGDGDGRVEMRAANGAHDIDGQHDGRSPDDGYLPEPDQAAGQHGHVNGAAAEKHQEKGAEHFGEATSQQSCVYSL